MQNEIVINASPGETRVAILEKNQLADLHLERATTQSVVANVVKGRVTRVLPGMQAAFVDIGLEKAAFLYAGWTVHVPYAGPAWFKAAALFGVAAAAALVAVRLPLRHGLLRGVFKASSLLLLLAALPAGLEEKSLAPSTIFMRPGSSVKLIWSRMTLSSNASDTRSKTTTGAPVPSSTSRRAAVSRSLMVSDMRGPAGFSRATRSAAW